DRWRNPRGLPPDGTMSLATMWQLADAWYRDRLDPAWRRQTGGAAETLFAQLGLTGDFWRLP
ncbi:MAG TPA: hypothetical protein VF221_00575, partial [Chloroflexota bacterium]